MEVYFLISLIVIVLILLIYSSIKTKSIYSENVEYEPKHEEIIKKVEKKLAQKGYKFQRISKIDCYYYLGKNKERITLPRIRLYRKNFKNYGLVINSEGNSLKDNLVLKKEVFDILMSKKTYGIIIFNEKNSSFEFAKRSRKSYIVLFIIVILCISLYFVIK